MKYNIELELRGFVNGRVETIDTRRVESVEEAYEVAEDIKNEDNGLNYNLIVCVVKKQKGDVFLNEFLLDGIEKKMNIYQGISKQVESKAYEAIENTKKKIEQETELKATLENAIKTSRKDDKPLKRKLDFVNLYLGILNKNLVRDTKVLNYETKTA